MKIYYSPYTLSPRKRANRLSSIERKHGVFLKGVLKEKTTYADYFPHMVLGDRSADQFLGEFKFQNDEYDKKIFDFILRDYKFQNIKLRPFKNHQLWSGTEALEAQTVKYKLLHPEDKGFFPVLLKGLKLRLDSNGMFSKQDFETFLKNIPEKHYSQIEYVEDPLSTTDWSGLRVPSARDFIEGSPFDFTILKPNCEFRKDDETTTIYSSYLGGELGQWHTYCEMIENADLKLTHGIVTRGFYEEETDLWTGSYDSGMLPDTIKIRKIYQDLTHKNWKFLCSI